MDLTGKCLKDCYNYHKVSKTIFCNWRKELQNALIIEFFDSVGIIINVLLDETNSKKFKYLVTDINIRHLHCWTQGTKKESRQEATTEAIKKANEIYNNLFLPK